jgi:hypothetical protein
MKERHKQQQKNQILILENKTLVIFDWVGDYFSGDLLDYLAIIGI